MRALQAVAYLTNALQVRGPSSRLSSREAGSGWGGWGETVNTSLIRECLELILMLADALERKKAGVAMQNSHPVTPQVAPVELFGSDSMEAQSGAA